MKKVSLKSGPEPLLIVLSGPSGAGKDAILNQLKREGYPAVFITTVTTRPKRAQEKEGVHYHFVSPERFQEMLKSNQFLEHANVYGNWYGVPREPVRQALEEGRDTIVKVDTQGAANIKKLAPQAVFIFVAPPSIEDLGTRLEGRRTESSSDRDLRLKTAQKEIEQLPLFDYLVVNRQDRIELAVSAIEAIINAEKHRVNPRQVRLG